MLPISQQTNSSFLGYLNQMSLNSLAKSYPKIQNAITGSLSHLTYSLLSHSSDKFKYWSGEEYFSNQTEMNKFLSEKLAAEEEKFHPVETQASIEMQLSSHSDLLDLHVDNLKKEAQLYSVETSKKIELWIENNKNYLISPSLPKELEISEDYLYSSLREEAINKALDSIVFAETEYLSILEDKIQKKANESPAIKEHIESHVRPKVQEFFGEFAHQFVESCDEMVLTENWTTHGTCFAQTAAYTKFFFNTSNFDFFNFKLSRNDKKEETITYQLIETLKVHLYKKLMEKIETEFPLKVKRFLPDDASITYSKTAAKLSVSDKIAQKMEQIEQIAAGAAKLLQGRVWTISEPLPEGTHNIYIERDNLDQLEELEKITRIVEEATSRACYIFKVGFKEPSEHGHVFVTSIDYENNQFLLYDPNFGAFSYPNKLQLLAATQSLFDSLYMLGAVNVVVQEK